MSNSFKKSFTFVKEYILMTLGMFIYSFGWIGCILPAHGVGGGAAGFSMIVCHTLSQYVGINIQIGTMVFIVNGILLLLGGFIVGWNFGIKTIYCIIAISLSMNFWQGTLESWQLAHDGAHFFGSLENFPMVILGGIVAGIGIALCFQQGGSSGGTDIVAMIINKYRTISYGRILIFSDFVIIGSSLLVGYHLDAVIYGYVMTAVVGYTVDLIMAGNQQSSQVLIITPDYERMAKAIVEDAHRGVTLLDSEGGYSHQQSKVVMVVCRKRETTQILNLVKRIDPQAFISVGSVMGVYGKGFEALTKI